ncbi:disulfide bond formation protein B [Helicobacter sp.]|uniref:disulfide bond formation protein B n=1 Tax=Helicobacter sp. TaxID=218 RepID=UPI0025C57876|nr:disulfide bond formation protein B [Helicobacter sp.]MCI5633443.1 disulfide bond formation protein B [Helicobacter sp.]MDY5557066.1 disulfide bond formation protein B [Helicobacter sp.]
MKILKSLKTLGNTRVFWIILGIVAIGIVLFSHFVIQEFLLIPPCEQCVYIRYAFVVLMLGCFIVALEPRSWIFKSIGVIVILYALVRGIVAARTLNTIHIALKEGIVFGLKGCSLEPQFDFNLPLDTWIPQLFRPLGFCGYDMPYVNMELSPFREWFIALYAEGWYVIPSLELGSMAQCALIIFVLYGLVLSVLMVANVFR